MKELNRTKLLESAEEFWSDESGRLGFAAKATAVIGQTVINGRLFEMQLVMTSIIEEIQLPTEFIL